MGHCLSSRTFLVKQISYLLNLKLEDNEYVSLSDCGRTQRRQGFHCLCCVFVCLFVCLSPCYPLVRLSLKEKTKKPNYILNFGLAVNSRGSQPVGWWLCQQTCLLPVFLFNNCSSVFFSLYQSVHLEENNFACCLFQSLPLLHQLTLFSEN